jgi:alcohol dehydrogenase class IV
MLPPLADAKDVHRVTTISYPTSVLFNDGAAKNLDAELAAASLRRPLVVADKGIVQAGVFVAVTAPVRAKFGGIFVDTPPNPTEAATRAALEIYRANDCDGVVAIGGGSPIDLERLRLRTTLTQMGFDRKHIPIVVTFALDDHSNATPRCARIRASKSNC